MNRALFFWFLAAACGAPEISSDPEYEVVLDGKEDNYRSPTALEFSARADATVKLDASDAALAEDARMAKARELVSAKLLQIGWFLNLWVADKEDEDANKSYGGYHAMARNSSVASLGITPVDATTFKFNFEATIAAQNGFLDVVAGDKQADGTVKAALKMGKLSNDELLDGGWQGRYDVHSW